MKWAARSLLAFAASAGLISLLMHRNIAGSSAAAAAPVPVLVGVVLDLTSDTGRKRLACVSMALEDFYAAHASSTARVQLRVRDSRGEVVAAAHAAQDLIKNAQVQAIIWGPHTPMEAHFAAHRVHRNRIPILSFSDISPKVCVFWLEDLGTASRGHAKIGFTLGNNSVTILSGKTGRRNARKLKTRKSRKSCRGPMLRMVVPHKEGFRAFVNVTYPNTKNQMVTGYSIDVFKAAMRTLQPRRCYNFFVFNGSYDELVGNVSSGMYHGAVGDVSITTERTVGTDFTMPYTPSGVSMLVLVVNEPETIQWTFVKPLTTELWLATVGFFFYTAFVLWMIERSRNHEYQGSSLRQFSTASYFAFSTLTFSHGQIIRSPLSKIVVVIWCFVVLILVQSYTASLSSMLTAKRFQPSVTDLKQIRLSGGFVGYQDQSFVRSVLMSHDISRSKLRSYTNKEQYADALRKGSKNGGVSAIVDEVPYLTSFLSDPRYQKDFMMVGSIYKTPGFGFAFNRGSPLVHNLSTAILNLTGGVDGSIMEAKWFGTAPLSPGAGTAPETDSTPLTFESVSGLFLITGSISTLMLLISTARLLYAKWFDVRANAEVVDNRSDGEDSCPSQNGRGDNSVLDQPLREAVNEDTQVTHVRGENAVDEDPGAMQQNVYSGSVPAESMQIEMSTV